MIQETMRGIAVAKSYRQEATIYREFEDVSDRPTGFASSKDSLQRNLPAAILHWDWARRRFVWFGGIK